MRRLLACASLAALSACSASVRSPRPPALPRELPAADVLRRLVDVRRRALYSLRAEARMWFSGPGGSGSAREVLLVRRPDQLRVEVLSLFGSPFVLATARGRLAAYVREENRVYRGAATAANLASYTGLGLSVPDVVELLLGNPPRRAGGHASVFGDPSTGQIRLRQLTAAGSQVLAFAGTPLVTVGAEELDADDLLLWRAEFAGHVRIADISIPHRIRMEIPGDDRQVEIQLYDPEINPALGEDLFALRVPPGGDEVRLNE